MRMRRAPLCAILFAAACALPGLASAQPMGKTKEYRSLNTDFYKISVQKNGQLDVFLATDAPAMLDAFPMVWFDGDPEPTRMKTSGKWTERLASNDKLGQGQGIIHQHEGAEWSIRAYPTRPYFAVQLQYTNTTQKPVRVKALLPWCVGPPGKGMIVLGPNTNDARLLSGATTGQPLVSIGAGRSADTLVILNPTTGRSIVAGFVTADRALGWIESGNPTPEDKKKPSGLGLFRATSDFGAPVVVAPGESIHSEVLYLAVAEPDPVVGLQRYARAVQVVNGMSGADHDAPLNAWVLSSADLADAKLLGHRLEALRRRVPLELVNRIAIRLDANAPAAGLAPILDAIRAAEYTPVLWISSAVQLVAISGLTEVAGVALDQNPFAAATQMKALRSHLGGDAARIYGDTPSLLAGALLDGVVTNSADSLYLTPQPARHEVYFPMTPGAPSRADLAVAAILGSGLLMPLPTADDDPIPDLAGRLLPSTLTAARPMDLFAEHSPRLFHLQRKMADGEVHIVAIANRSGDAPLPLTLPFASFGFTPGAYYTVYDFWRQAYLGTARDRLDLSVPPHDATVLVFRPFLGHPMLVATGTNIAQDSPALRHSDWDPTARTLSVELAQAPIAASSPRFTIAVPAPYHFVSATAGTSGQLVVEPEKSSVSIAFSNTTAQVQSFIVQFDIDR